MNKRKYYRIYFFDFDDKRYYPIRRSFGLYSSIRVKFLSLVKNYPDGCFIMLPV